ncbi:hypothetical protein [Acetivibrio straminisolvens]|uniref:hypothetical protein n=1 Tax=Acetivibrio straminisolvens TaxID=253314 RepID=UPI00138AD682|nr:hypothetical protein [Acetivibrio straminisolvens]
MAGILIKKYLYEDDIEKFKKITMFLVSAIKFILFILSVKKPTFLAILIILILYPFASHTFIKIGLQTVKAENKANVSNNNNIANMP